MPLLGYRILRIQSSAPQASAEQEQQCPVPAQPLPGQNAASPGALARAPLELLLKSCEEFLLVLHKYLEPILRLP